MYFCRIHTQGRSKRSGRSGHGRTNNRAGNLKKILLYFIIIIFTLIFFPAGLILEPVILIFAFFLIRGHRELTFFFSIFVEAANIESPYNYVVFMRHLDSYCMWVGSLNVGTVTGRGRAIGGYDENEKGWSVVCVRD